MSDWDTPGVFFGVGENLMEEIKVLTHGFVDVEFVSQVPNALVKFGSKVGFEVFTVVVEELHKGCEVGGGKGVVCV